MRNSIFALGLLAAVLIVPNAAFAGSRQEATQELNQSVYVNGSGNSANVNGTQITNQNQTRNRQRYCGRSSGSQRQYSDQLLNQNVGISGRHNQVNVNGTQRTTQNQVKSGC
ncbi:hypothetical protein NIES4071_01150 [Calothrix sp. NIES-4071]|nr:hypothetical protein NIES4071_01150 [Calothrix sp. NIES-4071]BAZ54461.1 hypothetical protein NIES4105_01140 [Calothrix sp. NIES-4105]